MSKTFIETIPKALRNITGEDRSVEVAYRQSYPELENGKHIIESIYLDNANISEIITETFYTELLVALEEILEKQRINSFR